MLLIFFIIGLSLTRSHAEDLHFVNAMDPYEAKMVELFNKLNSETDAKLNAMEKIISQKLTNSLVGKVEVYMIQKHTELENSIEKLENIMDINYNILENNFKDLDQRLNTVLKPAITKLEVENLKMDVIEKEKLDIRSTLLPEKPQVSLDQRFFAIVEIDKTAYAYNQIVIKKESIDVSVRWTTKAGEPADKSRIILNGTEVWSGAGDATSASFKIKRGGRFQIIVDLCNRNGCKHSDATEIIVADTDGNHLPPMAFPTGKNNEVSKQTTERVVAAYFMEWCVYDKNYPVSRVPYSNLTHLLYSLIPICGGDGINDSLKKNRITFDGMTRSCNGQEDFKVSVQDTYAALKMPQNGLLSSPYDGNFGQLMGLKQAKPDIKILMSVGGLTFSDPFSLLADQTKRNTFVASVKEFLQTWKFFDGVDIMWINPKTREDGKTYVQVMKELREMLNELSVQTSRKYELTSAISARWDEIKVVDYNEAQEYMDHIFLMSYGFKTSTDSLGHHAGLYAPAWNPQESYTADYATQYLMNQGVKSEKIVLGIFMYGLGWSGVHNYKDDNPFTGKATGFVRGTWDKGSVYYSQIANEVNQGLWEYHYDSVAEAPYVFRNYTGELISYDNARSSMAKAKYVRDNQLGGIFVRGLDADNGDLLNGITVGLGNNE